MENVLTETKGLVGIVTINRPTKLNALNIATRTEVEQALAAFGKDPEVRVVVLRGAPPPPPPSGKKPLPAAFIAGADIGEFAGQTPLTQRQTMREWTIFDTVESLPKPVIAAVHGFCLGGGMELAMACDLRVASDASRFGQPEINLAIIPGGGGTQRLTRLIGETKAMELILTGDMISAEEARQLGIVNHVWPAEEFETKTLELAEKLAEKSPIALQMAKEAVKAASRLPLHEGLEHEIDLFAMCFASEDKEEGVAAFLEKRKPVFKGR